MCACSALRTCTACECVREHRGHTLGAILGNCAELCIWLGDVERLRHSKVIIRKVMGQVVHRSGGDAMVRCSQRVAAGPGRSRLNEVGKLYSGK